MQELEPLARDYILLLLFTGMRRQEGGALRWTEIDFEQRLIRLPAARVKTRSPLALPMSDFVGNLLVARRSLGDATFVFPSFGESGHIVGVTKSLKVLRAKTGLEFSLHDLRRTFITVAEALDISPYAIKMLVNHALGTSVTEGYIKMDAARLRGPVQQVADKLKTLCGIAPVGGNVAVLRG